MHKPGIVAILAGLMTALAVFCSVSFAEDQGQALIAAAERGDLKRVKELLGEGADVNARNKNGWTALMNAAFNNKTDVVNVLLDKGADINEKGRIDRTALMWSIYGSHIETARLLLERGADVNAKTPSGRTALMEAAAADHQLEDHQQKEQDNGFWDRLVGLLWTRNHWGPRYPPRLRDPEIVKLLLQRGADVNARDKDGWTALKRAQKRGATEIVELLKAHGAKE